MFAEHRAQPVARALAPGRHDDPPAGAREIADVADGGVEDVRALDRPLRRERAAGLAAAIDQRALRGRLGRAADDARDGRMVEFEIPLVLGQVERVGRERPERVRAGLGLPGLCAGLVMIDDDGGALARRLVVERVEDDRAMAEIVEQRAELRVEQRQEMLHAGMAAAFAHRRVERVAGGVAAETRDIGLPETTDRLGRELHLAHRHEVERTKLADRALRLRIEGTDRFERRAEEVEPDGVRHAGREQVDDAAAHRVFAGVAHDVGAQEAVDLEPFGEFVGRHRIARRGRKALARDFVAGRHALQRGRDRRRQDARLVGRRARAGEAGEHRHPPRRDRGVRRDAVVGLAIPSRELEDLDVGRRERDGVAHHLGALALARDMHQHGRTLGPALGESASKIGQDEPVEPVGDVRQRDVFVGLKRLDGARQARERRGRAGCRSGSLLRGDDTAGHSLGHSTDPVRFR